MVKRNTPTAATLSNLYDVIREVVKDKSAYYTPEQVEGLKQDKSNIFLERGKHGTKRQTLEHSERT